MTNPLDESGRVDLLDVEMVAEGIVDPVIDDDITDDEKKEKISKKKISGLEARRRLEDNLDTKKIREALDYVCDFEGDLEKT